MCSSPRTACGPSTTASASTDQDKLRTVIWDFGGDPLDAAVEADLQRLAHDGPPAALCELLEPPELAATMDRVDWLLSLRALPELVDDGEWPPYPWPLV